MTNLLSRREEEVAQMVTTGLTNKEVASRLFVTEKTVKFHLTNIFKKEDVKSRAQLMFKRINNSEAIQPAVTITDTVVKAAQEHTSEEIPTAEAKEQTGDLPMGLGAQASSKPISAPTGLDVALAKSRMHRLIEILVKMQNTADPQKFYALFQDAMDIVYLVAAQMNQKYIEVPKEPAVDAAL